MKKVKTTFNETKKDVSQLRQKLIDYYNSHSKDIMTRYKVHYYENNNVYFNIDLDEIIIEADSKLSCIIIFKDYLNENLQTPCICDAYEDDLFYESYVYEIGYTDNWNRTTFNIDDIFNNDNIDNIIDDYVENCFNNDTLWFAVEKKITVLHATY